jgi:hypothetical protein
VQDQPLRTVDDLIAEINGKSIEEFASEPTEDGRRLITVDELRAAGALDVPAAWRKSLGGKKNAERDLLSGLFPDDDEQLGPQPPISGDDSADEP